MSINGSKKEKIYAVYLARNKEIIEMIIRTKLKEAEIEKYFEGRKVDYYAISNDEKEEVFLELQLTRADDIHFEQIRKIIQNISEPGYKFIVWIALDFEEEMFEKIKNEIDNANKNIEIICLKMNDKIIEKLEGLNNLNDFDIVDNIDVISEIKEQLNVKYKYYKYNRDSSNLYSITKPAQDDPRIIFINKFIQEIRKQAYYFISVYYTKNIAGNKVIYGTGVSFVNIQIGIDRKDNLYLELVFTENKANLYYNFKDKKDEIDDIFDYRLVWNDETTKIGIYVRWDESERQILEMTRCFCKFINNFVKKLKTEINDEIE